MSYGQWFIEDNKGIMERLSLSMERLREVREEKTVSLSEELKLT